MLSISKCREILGAKAANLLDSELELLRDQLYPLADVVVSHFLTHSKRVVENNLRDELEERAAILEFDGKISRSEAEQKAATDALNKLRERGQNL